MIQPTSTIPDPLDDPFGVGSTAVDPADPFSDLPADADPFSDLPPIQTDTRHLPVAAFYGRVSTDQQDLRTQIAWGQRYALSHGLHIPPELIFLDEDRSGRIPLIERERGRALTELLRGPGWLAPGAKDPVPVRNVIVSAFDRWGRDPDDSVRNVQQFHAIGVKIHFPDIPLYNPLDPSGILLLRIRSIFAEHEVNLIRQRITAKLAEKRRRGEVCGKVPFGWRDITRDGTRFLEEDPAEQRWLAHMLRRRAEGWGYHRIARELNEQGVRAKQGGTWQDGNVRNVILSAQRRAARHATETTNESPSA